VREQTRARVLAAACRCFAQHGYARTSNRVIAREAGVTTGALYHYFASKAALFAAVNQHVQNVLIEVYHGAFAEGADCVEQLCRGLEAALVLVAADPALTKFAATASLEIERHPELARVVEADRADARSFFEGVVQEGARRGELEEGVPVSAVVDVVVSSLFGLAWLRSEVKRPEDFAEAVRAFARLLRGGLFRPRPGAAAEAPAG
jgi:AcrR family transcriptional regulator